MNEQLKKKIERAIRFLRSIPSSETDPVEVCYSGGKDSDVILQLAKEAGIHYRAIYKCTTIDPPGTVAHVKAMKVEIHKPINGTFRELIIRKGLPSRIMRFCCEELKEYKILGKQIIGVRRCESRKRAERYTEPTACRLYGKKDYVEQFFPILDWTDADIKDYIFDRNIKCAPVYYDEDGTFHVERRLGCLCCPLQSTKRRIRSFRESPGMVVFYIHALVKFWELHPNVQVRKDYSSPYEQFVRDVFYPVEKDWEVHKHGLFADADFDYKTFLESYFKVKL